MAAAMQGAGRLIKNAFRPNIVRFPLRLMTSPMFLHTSSVRFTDLNADFNKAKERLNTLKNDPGNQAKLQIYGLFKQSTVGDVNNSRPGMMDFVGRAKWDAWNALKGLSQDEAKRKYISTVDELAGSSDSSQAAASSTSAETSSGEVTFTRDGKVNIIRLNRPDKKNAIKIEMYETIVDMFEQSAKDDSSITVLTGTGDFYCSGNDLSNFTQVNPAEIPQFAEKGGRILKQFVGAFIDFPKPLIAVINGPAVGISVTTLGLCDAVFATDRATFNTPFSALGQTPEGCSSYIFPKLMGSSKANEMLFFNRKLTAGEAFDRGLVTQVFQDERFQTQVWEKIRELSLLPPQTMRLAKKLIRDTERDILHQVNDRECTQLVERWQSEECIGAIMKFFSRKSNL